MAMLMHHINQFREFSSIALVIRFVVSLADERLHEDAAGLKELVRP